MKIAERDGSYGTVELDGVTRDVNLALVPDAAIGDYVIIHAGCAIEILDTDEAQKTINLFKDYMDSEEARKPGSHEVC